MTASESPAVTSEALTALLRHFDWSPSSKAPGLYEVWSSDDSDGDEILLPLNPSRGDYEVLIQRAVREVFNHYGRPAQEIFNVLQMRTAAVLDSTQWKKETSFTAGVIGWEEGEELYSSARAQLIASAKAARGARRYYGNTSSYLAKQFLDSTLMGQTDVGSFVITAYTPANQRFHATRHSEEASWSNPKQAETVSGRAILDTFDKALSAVRAALDQYKTEPRSEIFLEAVNEGVSYEFTRALSQFTTNAESVIQITRRPSRLAVVEAEEPPNITEVTFSPADAPVLARAATVFAQDPEPQDVTLVGEVTLLSRSSDDPDRLIRLNVEYGADIRKARVLLSEDQYEIAMKAHQEELTLRVSGRLEKEGNLYWLYNPSDVSIVPSRKVYRPSPSIPQLPYGEDR